MIGYTQFMLLFFFFKQKTAYEMRISDWSSDVCSSDLVHFKGETTLDNGITVGARVELEGQTSGDQIDETYAYFSGGFGEIRFGDEDEAAALTCVGEPGSVTANFGVNSPNEAFNNAGVNGLAGVDSFGSCFGPDSDALKTIYFTPQFGPVNFAVSYTPNARDRKSTRLNSRH